MPIKTFWNEVTWGLAFPLKYFSYKEWSIKYRWLLNVCVKCLLYILYTLCLKIFIIKNFVSKSVCHVGSPPSPPIFSFLLYPLKYGKLRVPNYSMWRLTSQCKSYTVVINYKYTDTHFSSCFVQDRALTNPFMQDLLRLINFFFFKASVVFK